MSFREIITNAASVDGADRIQRGFKAADFELIEKALGYKGEMLDISCGIANAVAQGKMYAYVTCSIEQAMIIDKAWRAIIVAQALA